MVATAIAPANFQTYKRRPMSDETSGGTDQSAPNREQYHLLKEFHRTLRQALTGSEYKVWCALEDWSESKGECWHSQSTIAEACDISLRSVNAAVKRLEQLGLVETKERVGQSSYYVPARPTYAKIAYLRENLRKICTGRYANSAQPPTQNLHTNGSNLNGSKENEEELISNEINGDVSPSPEKISKQEKVKPFKNAAIEPEKAKVPPLDKQGPLLHRYKTAYLEVGNAPANHNKRCGVIGDAWQEITGRSPNYPFIAKVMKEDCGGRGWPIIEAILGMANKDITDDPEGYLRRILQNGNGQQQQQPGRPYLAGNGAASGRTFQSAPKPIKPRGSRPDGGFSTAEYLEDY